MARYHFDVIDAGNLTRDHFGVDLVDDNEARDQAIALLPEMARTELPDGDQHEFVAIARNKQGETVYEASLALNGKWRPGQHR